MNPVPVKIAAPPSLLVGGQGSLFLAPPGGGGGGAMMLQWANAGEYCLSTPQGLSRSEQNHHLNHTPNPKPAVVELFGFDHHPAANA